MATNPAETYESYIVPALFEPFSLKLIERVEPQKGDRILDVACGTGIVARRAAPVVGDSGAVAGADPSPNMLAVARKAADEEGRPAAWHEAPAEALPFPDQRFDVVVCQQGAQFFKDPHGAAKEMFRVLDNGGRIGVTTWQLLERHRFFSALHSAMQRHVGSEAAAAPFGLSDAQKLRGLFEGAGFQQVEVDQLSLDARYPDPDRFLSETIDALAAVVTTMQDIDRQELEKGIAAVTTEMQEPLQQVTQGDYVVLPWHTNVVSGVR